MSETYDEAPDLLTVPEVAARLRASDEYVRRLLRSGRIVGVRVGGRKFGWRVPASELERILMPRKQTA